MKDEDSYEVIELLTQIKEELENVRKVLEMIKDHFEIRGTQ